MRFEVWNVVTDVHTKKDWMITKIHSDGLMELIDVKGNTHPFVYMKNYRLADSEEMEKESMSDITKEYEEVKAPLRTITVPGVCSSSSQLTVTQTEAPGAKYPGDLYFAVGSCGIHISKAHALELADLLKEMAG